MKVLWSVLRGVYDFVVGDDPKIAVAVVAVLAVLAGVVAAVSAGSWIPVAGALGLLLSFAATLLLDARRP